MKVPVYDIVNCGPRHRFAANGKIVHNSKGAAINMQNLKRGSFLRKAIMAPEGHVLVVGDLSQIEPRVLAWLADYGDLLNIFRSGQDVYAMFGRQMFNNPTLTRDAEPELRQSAKSALLGCFGSQTPVLTKRGWAKIQDVLLSDTLWDGVAWVSHAGVVDQGEKECLWASGVAATPDHKVLVANETWATWSEVHTSHSLFRQALSLAALPAWSGSDVSLPAGTNSTYRGCAASAAPKCSWHLSDCKKRPTPCAPRAGTKSVDHQESTARNLSLFLSGTSSASYTALGGTSITGTGSPSCAVPVGGKVLCREATWLQVAAHAATGAPNVRPLKRGGSKRDIAPCVLMTGTESAYWTASAPSLSVVPIKTAPPTQTTAAGVLACTRRGQRTVSSFCATWSDWTAGINPTYSLIGATTSAGTSRATCALSHEVSTWPTSARSRRETLKNSSDASRPLRQRMQTYDIACAGPRNRYTILTDAGPLIVHNCGYGLGWASFAQQLLTGFLGAPPIRYDKAFAKKLGVTPSFAERFLSYKPNEEALLEIQANCSMEELVIHCLAAARIIEIYRDTAAPVKAFWGLLDSLIESSLYGGDEFNYKDVLLFRKEEIVLPSGMSLRYPGLKRGKDEKGRLQWTYGPDDTKLYAGKICNNVTQGVARVVMTDGMLRVAKRYFVAGTVHDEQIVVVPEKEAEAAKTWVHAQMTRTPAYLPGIPLNADVGAHRRYGLAKS